VLGAEENVLRAAQPDALRAEFARLGPVLGGVGVGAHAQAAELVRPAQHGLELAAHFGLLERHVVGRDDAGAAVDRDPVALRELGVPHA
jgi:hypothetical protein